MYVYWQSEPGLWTVGYFEPNGTKVPESDHDSTEKAAERVHYLNGGDEPDISPLWKMKEYLKTK